jgi:glycosyltransferase involved in cell wall biosynthesis
MKGIHYLAQAFTTLKHRFPQLKLVCAGTLATEDEVRSSFPESVRESVRVYPLVNEGELREILANAEIFVFPTLSEGASLALAEAMASALPIVTTRVGAAPDMLEHEQSVLFVECADPTMLSDAIERVAGDQKLREKLGLNARRAADCLAPSLVWRGYADCVDRLMNWQTSAPQDKVETVFAGRTR